MFDMTKVPDRDSDAVAGNYNVQKDCEDNSYRLTTRSGCHTRGSMKAIFGGNRKEQWG